MPPPAKIDPEKEKSINQFLHITEDFGAAKKLLEQNRLQQVGQSFKKPPHPKEQRHISDQLSHLAVIDNQNTLNINIQHERVKGYKGLDPSRTKADQEKFKSANGLVLDDDIIFEN